MCFFDHSFGYNFLFSVFSQKGCLNFEKKGIFSNSFKMQQLRLLLEEKSTLFAAPEVTLVFSMARCLSVKWLGR